MLCLKYDEERELALLSQRAQLSLLHVFDLPSVPLYGYSQHIEDIQPFLRRVKELMTGPQLISEADMPVKEIRDHLEQRIRDSHPTRFIREEDWAALCHVQGIVATLDDHRRPTNPQIVAALTFCRNIVGFRVRAELALLPPASQI